MIGEAISAFVGAFLGNMTFRTIKTPKTVQELKERIITPFVDKPRIVRSKEVVKEEEAYKNA